MNTNLMETAKDHMIVVAHSGISGGNIPGNTMTSFEIALMQGVDMIEMDVSMSADGVLIIFHPGMEEFRLGMKINLSEMPYEEIRKLRYQNSPFGIPTFDEVLERLKGRCFINVDKFWDHPKEIYQAVKRHGMLDQIVVKTAPSEDVFRFLEEVAPDMAYLPIVKNTYRYHEELMRRSINYVGAEFVFDHEDAEVAGEAMKERMHQDDKLIWVNAIVFNERHQLAAGHSDNTALSESLDKGWGWLADQGFDMIQTDWAGMMIDYLKRSNKYYHS